MIEFSKNKWKYSTIGLMAVLAVGFSFPQAFAAPIDSVLSIVRDIQAKVNDPTFGLEAIKNGINNGADQTSVNNLQTTANDIKSTQYVPFSAVTSNTSPVVCVPNEVQFDDDHIVISSSSDLMITGVIIKPENVINPDDLVAVPFVTINGQEIFISSGDLGPTGSTASNDGFDIMTASETFPHQVAGSNIQFEVLCQHDTDDDDINFSKIFVTGWKKAGTSVSVTYQE